MKLIPIVLVMPVAIAGAGVGMQPAAAELMICNTTNGRISVAIGYSDRGDWISEGWWNIGGGACQAVVDGSLSNRFYYYFAKQDQGNSVWDGNHNFCIAPNRFAIVGDDECGSRGYAQQGFREIDVGGSTTYSLKIEDR